MSYNYTPKKAPNGDWDKVDIIASLKRIKWSLRALSMHHGLAPSTLKMALYRKSYPKGENHICEALRKGGEYPNIQPEHIWPSRYFNKTNSTPKKRCFHGKNKGVNCHA